MKKNNIAVLLILAVSAVLFTLGVVKKIKHTRSAKISSEQIIAVIPKGTASMWWEVVRSGAEQAGKEEGYKISWNGPEQENDREKQIQSVEDALSHGIKALVLGPNDSKALVRPVEKVKQTGIPVVIIDSSIETDQYDSFAATDNVAGGADAARRLGAALNGHGKVILTCFIQNSASTDDRAKGFKETLAKEFPGIELIAEQYTQGTVEDARQKTVDMLTKHSDADGVFAVNQPTSVGAYKALQSTWRARSSSSASTPTPSCSKASTKAKWKRSSCRIPSRSATPASRPPSRSSKDRKSKRPSRSPA